MQNQPCFHPEPVLVDWEGVPVAIVAVHEGEPVVLTVSAETLALFKRIQMKLGMNHVSLANMLRKRICQSGGQFHENAVLHELRYGTIS